jgi:hypothetical protein
MKDRKNVTWTENEGINSKEKLIKQKKREEGQ